ncbi:hypothetical protein PGT21_036724 [Puccinia graminis f. sp. tritici]|uniref:Uncharacterized protein n=1 Tax=Puccinia graminis f. sp. tritici TaxID=56615 RepID=A0A5B0R358_PUCGR|nr:hypothetical protein PGT21_036724 [Puccinia graminis f. sp. tritici]
MFEKYPKGVQPTPATLGPRGTHQINLQDYSRHSSNNRCSTHTGNPRPIAQNTIPSEIKHKISTSIKQFIRANIKEEEDDDGDDHQPQQNNNDDEEDDEEDKEAMEEAV